MPPKRKRNQKVARKSTNRKNDQSVDDMVDVIRQEMEVAQHAASETGQLRRKLPRRQSKVRTRKLKQLRSQDNEELVEEAPIAKRLRGSAFAAEDNIIMGSLIFGAQRQTEADGQEESDQENASAADAAYESEQEPHEGNDGERAIDEEDSDGTDADDSEKLLSPTRDENPLATKATKTRKQSRSRTRKTRRMHRLKNFKSVRMGLKHGEVLAAHAQGKPHIAIKMLKDLARENPSAPQVYESLGTVYEDMLKQCRQRSAQKLDESSGTSELPRGNLFPDSHLAEQLDLAKKAYGAFHCAAILCKRDYSLWVRSGDMALDIADIHAAVLRIPHLGANLANYHRSEKERWLSEAKNDFQTADNLRPPGIDVPAKLASVLMELGHFSEALTILTDLKNQTQEGDGTMKPNEFESSYRAWLLFADLMLRIGYECEKWNGGDESNSNYMFRRWLRKHSDSFDWKERRLQALAMALEAAAGSTNCSQLIGWLQNRAAFIDQSLEKEQLNAPKSQSSLINENDDIDVEKELLRTSHKLELEAFDKTTAEMDPEMGAAARNQRSERRQKLVDSQKAEEKNINVSGSQLPTRLEQNKTSSPRKVFSVSASCKTVCNTALKLMLQMLNMGLCIECRMAGEAVSSYFKARSASIEKRFEARKLFDFEGRHFPFSHKAYDEFDGERSSSEESDTMLSDDEALDDINNTDALRSLSKGQLPPELLLWYGLSLAVEGGKNLVAAHCLKNLDYLEVLKTPVELTLADKDDIGWSIFKKNLSDSIDRTSAYALVAKYLHEPKADSQLYRWLLPLYTDHVKLLTRDNELLRWVSESNERFGPVLEDIQEVLVATARFLSLKAQNTMKAGIVHAEGLRDDLLAALQTIGDLYKHFWRLRGDGSISEPCTNSLEVFSTLLDSVRKAIFDSNVNDGKTLTAVKAALRSVGFILGVENFEQLFFQLESPDDFIDVPFPHSWQSDVHKAISVRVLNLCAGSNVTLFSGWERKEFSASLLRDRPVPSYFGVTISDGQVAGFLSTGAEEEMADQWHEIGRLSPITFDFRSHLTSVRKSPWYQGVKEKFESARANHPIACFNEDQGLNAIFSFSRLCLRMAAMDEFSHLRQPLLSTWLSILLPVSQFSLNLPLWRSDIGRGAASESLFKQVTHNEETTRIEIGAREMFGSETVSSPFENDLQKGQGERTTLALNGVDKTTVQQSIVENSALVKTAVETTITKKKKDAARAALRRSVLARRPKVIDDNIAQDLDSWFGGEDDYEPLSNVVSISCRCLWEAWIQYKEALNNDFQSTMPLDDNPMKMIDLCLKDLRKCFSEDGVETAALKVASSMVDLITGHDLSNPFLCIQQAALFASQASKCGTGEILFKQPLPTPQVCTPRGALGILARAECLNSLHLCPEAAFLCSFVASLSSYHRSKNSGAEWDARWKLVAIQTYNTSVAVRHTAWTLKQISGKAEDYARVWERDIVDELKRARCDAISMRDALDGDLVDGVLSFVLENYGKHDVAETIVNVGTMEPFGDCIQDPVKHIDGKNSVAGEENYEDKIAAV